jgi:hypothetical protein
VPGTTEAMKPAAGSTAFGDNPMRAIRRSHIESRCRAGAGQRSQDHPLAGGRGRNRWRCRDLVSATDRFVRLRRAATR